MREYIYKDEDDGKYYRQITDWLGNSVLLEEISQQEYLSYRR
jgi:hypothetical protein